jgi:CreA protein
MNQRFNNGIAIMIVAVILICIFGWNLAYGETTAVKIGEVTCIDRIVGGDDVIPIIRIDDPENPFISIYVSQVTSGAWLAISDPSNSSIATRLTGEIPLDADGKQIINKNTNLDIGHFRKSIGSKVMKIARWYDHEKNVLVYVVYTTKAFDGSAKHSLSVVPLGVPLSK